MDLTKEDILADLAGYQDRLSNAERKLAELPAKPMTYAARKRARRSLVYEIKHLHCIMNYAKEALADHEVTEVSDPW